MREWLRQLPKAELHVHLEGTMSPALYRRIAERNSIEVGDDETATYRCSDFPSFLQGFLTTVKALQKPEDYAEIARDYLAASASEGVRHVEFMLSPATPRIFAPHLDIEAAIAAIVQEFEAARARTGISALLIFDMVRNLGVNAALRDAKLAEHFKSKGVVGIGLGGDEKNYPAIKYQDVYLDAERAGLRRTAHAGEADGPASVVDAVMLLHAERVGHAVAAAKNPKVLKLLGDHKVAIDACLTSNVVTGAVKVIDAHPISTFLEAGLTVTLNSDDPAFFGSSLLDEYELAAERLGFTKATLARIAANSFAASFASEEKKKVWLAELERFVGAAA